jgi:hypothetical protein
MVRYGGPEPGAGNRETVSRSEASPGDIAMWQHERVAEQIALHGPFVSASRRATAANCLGGGGALLGGVPLGKRASAGICPETLRFGVAIWRPT